MDESFSKLIKMCEVETIFKFFFKHRFSMGEFFSELEEDVRLEYNKNSAERLYRAI